MSSVLSIEAALELVRNAPDYRVLQRVRDADKFCNKIDAPVIGAIVDVETTGLSHEQDEIIEICVIKFEFNKSGEIGKFLGSYQSYNEPARGIPHAITELTGITEEAVKGFKINSAELEAFISDVSLVIAHNAAFDRPFCEAICPTFSDLSWACSATGIDWRDELIGSFKLEYIAYSYGKFYDAHHAYNDCEALLNILSYQLPKSKDPVLLTLLEGARQVQIRMVLENAPYDLRHKIKSAGFKWSDGKNGFSKGWWLDTPEDKAPSVRQLIAEWMEKPNAFIMHEFRLTAKNRFKRSTI